MKPALPAAMLTSLSAMLARQTGLNFPEERWGDLERGLHAAARESGARDVQTYIGQLLSAPPTPQQTEILAAHLTVGETYFFRDSKSFEALEQQVLPQLIAARGAAGKRLRIWCAGCCTGEEPYSVAMLLDRMLPAPERWQVTLLATDINPHFLRKAERGVYGEWSFRDTPGWVKQRYFTPLRDGRAEILPRIKQQVTFRYLNLADDVYPSQSNDTHDMDLLLCRNVLMYFTPSQAEKVVGKLHRALAGDGWLLTSAVEASNTLFGQFAPVNFSGTAFYRKTPAQAAAVLPPSAREVLPHFFAGAEEQTVPPLAVAAPLPQAAATPPAPPQAQRAQTAAELCAAARQCADGGRLGEAADLCARAIAADKLDPYSHYLLATIHLEQGLENAAEQALKRALYLDPEFVMAFFTLGNLYLSQGKFVEARRNFGNALKLLQQHLPDAILAQAEGMTVWRLHKVIQSVLDNMPSAATILLPAKGVSHASGNRY